MSYQFIIASIFGFLGVVIWLLSILNSQKKTILIFQTIANFLYALQYLFLGVGSAAVVNAMSGIRGAVFFKWENDEKPIPSIVFAAFLVLLYIIAFFVCDSLFSLIPILLATIYAYSFWQKNVLIVRIIYIVGAVIWIYYNFSVGAYVAIIGNILEIIFGMISIFKHRQSTTA